VASSVAEFVVLVHACEAPATDDPPWSRRENLLRWVRALRAIDPVVVSADQDGRSEGDLVLDPEDDCVRALVSCHVPLSSSKVLFSIFLPLF
jgi:hypothetical protein